MFELQTFQLGKKRLVSFLLEQVFFSEWVSFFKIYTVTFVLLVFVYEKSSCCGTLPLPNYVYVVSLKGLDD